MVVVYQALYVAFVEMVWQVVRSRDAGLDSTGVGRLTLWVPSYRVKSCRTFEKSFDLWKIIQSHYQLKKLVRICLVSTVSADGQAAWGTGTMVIQLGFRLTHLGRVTHICVCKLTNIGSDNGLSLDRRQAIIWINAGILLIGPLGRNFSEIVIEIQTFQLKKMRLKMSSAKRQPFCLGLNELSIRLVPEVVGNSLRPTGAYIHQWMSSFNVIMV